MASHSRSRHCGSRRSWHDGYCLYPDRRYGCKLIPLHASIYTVGVQIESLYETLPLGEVMSMSSAPWGEVPGGPLGDILQIP